MKKTFLFLIHVLILFLFSTIGNAAWYDYWGIQFPENGEPYSKSKSSEYSLSLETPYIWKPAGIELFTLDFYGGWDIGYKVLFGLNAGEGIDVAKDGFTNPQLISRFDLKYGASGWLQLKSPGVYIDFWSIAPITIDLLELLGVNAKVDLRVEVPEQNFLLPFLSDGSKLIDVRFNEGIYAGNYNNRISYDLSSKIPIPGIEANIGTAFGIRGGIGFGLDGIRYYNENMNEIGRQSSAYSGVDVSNKSGQIITVSKRDYEFKAQPSLEAGLALYLGFSFMGFTIDAYVPPQNSAIPDLISGTVTPEMAFAVPYTKIKSYSVPTSQNSVLNPAPINSDPLNVPPEEIADPLLPLEQPQNNGLTVTNPTAGSRFRKGDSLYIGWIYPFTRVLALELYKNGQFERDIGSGNGKDGIYLWKLPIELDEYSNYKVKVTAPEGSYGFSGSFTVYTASVPKESQAISTFQEFQNMQERQLYHLTNDIDGKSAIYTPIPSFKGKLDGRGFTISNFDIEQPGVNLVGLFKVVFAGAVIKNLNFKDVYVIGKSNVGLIAGEFAGLLENVHTSECYVRGDQYGNGSNIGGLVGENYKGEIKFCSVTGTGELVKGYGDNVGGIAGNNSMPDSKIKYSWVSGDYIRAHSDSTYFVDRIGGITGNNYGTIQECYTELKQIDSDEYGVGGIAGANNGYILDSYSTSNIYGGDNQLGGIVGNNSGQIFRCYSTGPVQNANEDGGIAGRNDGTISDSVWDLSVTGKTRTAAGGTVNNSYGILTEEMKQAATYTALGWDFNNIWSISEGLGYPVLRAAGHFRETPQITSVSGDNPTGINISWAPAPIGGATFFRVYRSDFENGTPQPLTLWISNTSFIDSTALAGANYLYSIRSARTPTGEGASSYSAQLSGYKPRSANISVEAISESPDNNNSEISLSGGIWYVNGNGPYENLQSVSVIAPGTYTITFNNFGNLISPKDISVVVEPDETAHLSVLYSYPTGKITLNSNPIDVKDDGGRWRLKGKLWRKYGETLTNVHIGLWEIEFKDAANSNAPEPIIINVIKDTAFSNTIEYWPKGDFSGDRIVTLTDAVLCMKILTGIDPNASLHFKGDVNKNAKIDLQDLVYILQKLAGMRDTELINVALDSRGAIATASSYGTYGGISQVPARVNDGDEETTWAGTAIPAWCKVTLAKSFTINKVRVSTRYHTQEYDVELSADGTVWNKIVAGYKTPDLKPSGEDEGLHTAEFSITPQIARYMRIIVNTTDAPSGHIYKAIVSELQAFANSSEQ